MFSGFVNFKGLVLFEEAENFRGLPVFDFGPYTEVENPENSEIFPRHAYFKEHVFFQEVENFPDF